MRCEVAFFKHHRRNSIIISSVPHFLYTVLLSTQFLCNLVQTAPSGLNESNDKHPLPIVNIPDTIVALDLLRSSLSDILDDFKFVTENNQTKLNLLEEGNRPLTLDDIRKIEHNGDNPLEDIFWVFQNK